MTEDDRNVLKFPSDRVIRVGKPPSDQDVKQAAIDYLVDSIIEHFFSSFSKGGIDVRGDETLRMFSLSMECLRASAYHGAGISHPLQDALRRVIEGIDKKIDTPTDS